MRKLIGLCFVVLAMCAVGCSDDKGDKDGNSGGAGAASTAGTMSNTTAGSGGSTAGSGSGTAGTGTGTAGVSEGVAGMSTGTAGVSEGTAGMSSAAGGPKIPTTTETCPELKTGMVKVLGQDVQLWVGEKQADKKGAIFFYWHGTGGKSTEAQLLGPAREKIVADGGIVASFTTSIKEGTNTANGVWYTGDFKMADILLNCAIAQLNIDTRRIYTGGCSAGGLQAGSMMYERSSYLAGAMPNSGGIVRHFVQDDPSHMPAVITAHGALHDDFVQVEFTQTSANLCNDVVSKGGFAVNCDHGQGHCESPPALVAAQWEFLEAHPFGVDPEPYATALPADFPDYCKIVQ